MWALVLQLEVLAHIHLYLDPQTRGVVEAEALRKSAFCLGVFHYVHSSASLSFVSLQRCTLPVG